MKKSFILIFIFCSVICYSQTWVELIQEGDPWFGTGEIIQECTIISSADFTRLTQQYRETYSSCDMTYTDRLELRNYPVKSGTRPNFSGYYFILIKMSTWTGASSSTIFVYGHPNTGRLEIAYPVRSGIRTGNIKTNSAEYTRLWNQYLRWIKVE